MIKTEGPRTVIVELKTLLEDNPCSCFSPLRVMNLCHNCPSFRNSKHPYQLKCKPHIKSSIKKLLIKKKRIIKAFTREIATIDQQLQEAEK